MMCTLPSVLQFSFFIISIFVLRTNCKYAEGIINTQENWIFLERFCFLSIDGDLSFDFTFPIEYEGQTLLLYYDEETDQWPAVYKSGKKCAFNDVKESRKYRVVKLDLRSGHCMGNRTLSCTGERSFSERQSRCWFVVFTNCGTGNKTCIEKTSPPHIKVNTHQSIELSRTNYWSGCNLMNSSDTDYPDAGQADASAQQYIRCVASRGFKSARERWWYMAFSRCSNDSLGLKAKYSMLMTNSPNKGDKFFRHFSADEFYILQTDIGFMVVMTLILIISICVAILLKNRQLFHTTYKMYMISLSLECLHLLFMVIAFAKYANDGLDNSKMKTFARILEAASILMFLLMLIVMAKGYTITRGRLSTSGSIKVAVFMTVYTVVYAILFIYEAQVFDPGLVLYLYESPAGYGLIGMRLVGWLWFCYAIFFTLKHYPEKSTFYYPFFLFFTIWFWAGPISVFISLEYIDHWVREKVVNGVSVGISTIAYLLLLILTRPSAANSNFPYHVRTSQIGVMSGLAHTGAPVTANPITDSFGMNTYAPDYYTTPNFQDLFGAADPSSNARKPETNGTVTENYPHKPSTHNPFTVNG